jgi:type I restriction enzyme S subunit
MSASLIEHFDLLATAPGGVARLRELILTLAVQGKLVQQDPTDEPASVLLQKIRTEKDRLIAEGKIKRDKPLAPIADEEKPFDVPKGWAWVRLNTLLQKIGAGSTPLGGKEVYSTLGVKFLRSQNVWNDGLRLAGVAFIRPETHAKMIGTLVVADDLLFNITGASIGRCAVVPSDFDEANVSQHVTIVRPVLPAINAFLHKVLVSQHVQQAVMAAQVGVSREGLSIAKLGNFLIPVPPLSEQSRIVARVEELMCLCDALEAKGKLDAVQHAQLLRTLLGTLTDSASSAELAANWQRVAEHFDLLLDRPEAVDALEQTILQLAVRGLLVPQDPSDEPASVLLRKIRAEKDRLIAEGKIKRDKPLAPIADEEKPFELPVGWEWVLLGSLTSLVTSGSRSWKDFYAAEGATFIRSQDIKYDRLEFDDRAFVKLPSGTEGVRTQVRLEDLLVTITGANVGKAAVVSKSIPEAYVSQHVALVRLLNVRMVDYLHLWLVSEHGGRKLLLMSSYGAKPGLNLQNISDLLVPLPPLAEQSRIVARVEQLRQLCSDLRQRLTASRTTQGHLADALVVAAVSPEAS